MPRRNHERRHSTRTREVATTRRPRPAARNLDEEALALRDEGKSYSAIARSLEMQRAVEAHAAFIRALHRRSGEEREEMAGRERDRLDRLETRIRTRDSADPDKVAHRLLGLEELRKAIP